VGCVSRQIWTQKGIQFIGVYMIVTCVYVCVGPTSCTNNGIPVWHSQCLLTKLLCIVAAQRDGWVCYWWRISWVSLSVHC